VSYTVPKKNTIAVYLEVDLHSRFTEAKMLREKLFPPGYKSASSYAAHLIEEGLKLEEKELEDAKVKKTQTKKAEKGQ
jgi:hypothetical protein